MKTILRLTSRRAQVALAAALLLGCSLNVIVAAAYVARSGDAVSETPARWGSIPLVPTRLAGEIAGKAAGRAAGEGGAVRYPFRPGAGSAPRAIGRSS
ncbi:hypothetical protein DB459_20015 [Bradyrhizobium sp. WD16]|nr:hypothetical protein DB459_20015 [Bradyrhizobium sp. WD16]